MHNYELLSCVLKLLYIGFPLFSFWKWLFHATFISYHRHKAKAGDWIMQTPKSTHKHENTKTCYLESCKFWMSFSFSIFNVIFFMLPMLIKILQIKLLHLSYLGYLIKNWPAHIPVFLKGNTKSVLLQTSLSPGYSEMQLLS